MLRRLRERQPRRAGESFWLFYEAPWLRLTSECQWFRHPPPLNNMPSRAEQPAHAADVKRLSAQLHALVRAHRGTRFCPACVVRATEEGERSATSVTCDHDGFINAGWVMAALWP
eukprot:SAG25_NODE_21_length_22373_cov_13.904373_11_plen_115_part_00